MTEADCPRATGPDATPLPATAPGGESFDAIAPALLREQRTSIKWDRFPADVLPLFVAEMDFPVASAIKRTLIERIEASDIGYVNRLGDLAPAFADFARDRWGWEVPHEHLHLATDVATGVVEALRVFRPGGGRLVIPAPTYPGFFEMLQEVDFEVVEIPLRAPAGSAPSGSTETAEAEPSRLGLDLAAIEREFAAGADAFVLCNPHNPHGIAFTVSELTALARLAAKHDVFVIADEVHAPLTHSGAAFTPFAPLAAAAGALSATATSASKGWNLAGAKCSLIIAADARANEVLTGLPPEVLTRTSLLGLHASIAAFRDSRDWLDDAIALVEANERLLATLVRDHLPGVSYVSRPEAGYLAWLDFTQAGLGDDPYRRILEDARVALNDGKWFGIGGAGHVRLNLACAPHTIREAVARIARILPDTHPTPEHLATARHTDTPAPHSQGKHA